MSNVVAIGDGLTGELEPNETCIKVLEDLVQRAKAGEIVGVSVASLHYDGLADFWIAGRVGGYSMLGAIEMARSKLVEFNDE